jgi:hypothetical protein
VCEKKKEKKNSFGYGRSGRVHAEQAPVPESQSSYHQK